MSRTKNSLRNVVVSLGSNSLLYVVMFAYRTVFIYTLSAEYLGLNGLFTNIMSILALAELGIGTAVTYSLYKPIADQNTEKIKSLVRLYRRLYVGVGAFVMGVGLCLTPFLHYFVKEMPDITHISVIYILYVITSSISYFLLYGQTVIAAHQKNYINTIYKDSVILVVTILQCVILVVFHNYIATLVLQMCSVVLSGCLLIRKAERLYPYLKDRSIQPLEEAEKDLIKKNIFAMLHHHIGTVVVLCTDNLLISKFVGVAIVGVYSNYMLIISGLNNVIGTVIRSVTASMGNLGASEDKDHQIEVFYDVFFLFSVFLGMVTVCLAVLLQPFMMLWVGEEYVMSTEVVVMIVVNFYLMGMRNPTLMCHDTYGLFWYDRYKPIVEAVINLVASLILGAKLGVLGILIGTTISTVTVCLWVEPYVLYKYVYEKPLKDYFCKYLQYSMCTALVTGLLLWFTDGFAGSVLMIFVKKLVCCGIVVLVGCGCLVCRSEKLRSRVLKLRKFM